MFAVPLASADSIKARWEIDLSPGIAVEPCRQDVAVDCREDESFVTDTFYGLSFAMSSGADKYFSDL